MARRGKHHRWTLIDGHNLLYRDPALRRFLPDDPQRAHHGLERRLAGRARVVVFYDGGPDGREARHHRHGLELHYSGAGDADDLIVAWLRRHPERQAVVVTADRELAGRARAHGARVVTGLDADPAPGGSASAEDRGPPSPAEVDHWLRLFGADGETGSDNASGCD